MEKPESTQRHSDKEIPPELFDLEEAIHALPKTSQDQVEAAFNRVIDTTRRRRRILHLVQEVLEQLRIDMKFMMFDLEATRRERDAYRRQLEEGEKEEDGDDHFFD